MANVGRVSIRPCSASLSREIPKSHTRQQLHARFSTNKHGWHQWVFDHLLSLPSWYSLLELGCGPVYLWRENKRRIPAGWYILPSDFSSGMLQQARGNLSDITHSFAFEVIDAQNIPFDDETFDVVIANHTLCHVPDRARAFSETRRILKPGGRLFASTVGVNHLCELSDLVRRFDSGLTFRGGRNNMFTLENGQSQIEEWFSDMILSRYDDALIVTEPNPLSAYILSGASIPKNRQEEFARFVEAEMEIQPNFHITKDTSMFEACRDTATRMSN